VSKDFEKQRMFVKQDLIKIANQRMPFGRYAGRAIIDLPEAYLLWFQEREFPDGKLGELMAVCLEIKVNGLESLIDPLRDSAP
jgi:uncharacterized protein (DUF3820 family)